MELNLHRPKYLDDLQFQPGAKILKQMLKQEIPNLLLYGPNGSGKKSLLYSFLYEKYGIETKHTKCINKIFKINSKDVEIPYFYSNYHVEIQISDFTNYTRNILPEIIKLIGTTKNIIHNGCKILVFHQADKMDSYTQNMLRKFFEKYYQTCRFILLTSHLNKIIKPLQSRCLFIRIPAPSTEQIKSIIPSYNKYHRNMKLAWIEDVFQNEENLIETYIKNILKGSKTNPQEFIYALLIKNYDFLEVITLLYEMIRNEIKDENKLRNIIEIIARYSRRLCKGSRDIVHMEALFQNLNLII